jgi:hypothetical protein
MAILADLAMPKVLDVSPVNFSETNRISLVFVVITSSMPFQPLLVAVFR